MHQRVCRERSRSYYNQKMNLLTIKQAASYKGVSPPTIYSAINRGTIVKYDKSHIDIDDPLNSLYFSKPKQTYLLNTKTADQNNLKVQQEISFDAYLAYCDESKEDGLDPEPFSLWVESEKASNSVLSDIQTDDKMDLALEKVRTSIAYDKSKKLKVDLANAEKFGAIIDQESLQRKFGAFRDIILNELLVLPDSISDLLWSKAKESEEPVLAIATELQKQLSNVITRAKDAAKEITMEEGDITYVFE